MALARQSGSKSAPVPVVTRHTVREMANIFSGRKARILLVEDNIINQQVAFGILKKLGLKADAVANGLEALKSLETIPYDLVLMDVQMPEMDGYEATRVIRGWQGEIQNNDNPVFNIRNRASRIPIIAMTANALEGDREICLAAGMDDYVSKPISAEILAEALDKWLPKESLAVNGQSPGPDAGEPQNSGAILYGKGNRDKLDQTVFDWNGVLERLMGDEELAREVLKTFLEDIPRKLDAIKEHLEKGNPEEVQRQAHTIKGASANICGKDLSAVAFDVEILGKAGKLDLVRARMEEMERQFQRLKQEIMKII